MQLPVDASQLSTVHTLLSEAHDLGWVVHVPATQVLMVHSKPSSQLIGVFEHTPFMQVSVVHKLPSLQLIGTLTHAFVAELQVDVKQALGGTQLDTCVQVPPTQVSVVQVIPSSQFNVFTHRPLVGLHESTVHALPSLQVIAG